MSVSTNELLNTVQYRLSAASSCFFIFIARNETINLKKNNLGCESKVEEVGISLKEANIYHVHFIKNILKTGIYGLYYVARNH